MKLRVLRARSAGQARPRVATGATATPIANSMVEAWVMQKYLRPDLLADAGVEQFDSWAATFGKVVTRIEMKPEGNGFRPVDRFAEFVNVPELLRMWHVMGDVKTAADLTPLMTHVPALAPNSDGDTVPEVITVPRDTALEQFMQDLAARAEDVRARAVEPEDDNMLRISSDGRTAAMDLRLLRDNTTHHQSHHQQ